MLILAEELERASKALSALLDSLRLAFYDGYYPRNDSSDSKSVVLPDPDACKVPGAKYDTGLGNYRSRMAFQEASRLLREADVRLAWLLLRQKALQAALPAWEPHNLRDTLATATSLSRRLTWASQASLDLAGAAQVVDLVVGAHNRLARLFPEAEQQPVRICKVCERRPAAKKRLLCNTCKTYRNCHGRDRPRAMDSPSNGIGLHSV